HDAWQAPFWWDKIKIWFMPLGWRPRGLPPKPPAPEVTRANVIKYDVRPPRGLTAYVLVQYVMAVLLASHVLNTGQTQSLLRLGSGGCGGRFVSGHHRSPIRTTGLGASGRGLPPGEPGGRRHRLGQCIGILSVDRCELCSRLGHLAILVDAV